MSLKRIASTLTVMALIILGTIQPAQATTSMRVAFTNIGIYPRADRSMSSSKVGAALPDGTFVTIECEAEGEPVSNGYQTISVWEKLTDGTWLPNSFVDTGYAGYTPGVPRCGSQQTATASQASASALPGGVTCYGDYCSGQDPESTGCAKDAVTIEALATDTGGGRLELRWSQTCKTNWARWQQYPTGWCMNCTPIGLVAVQDTGYTQKVDWFEAGTSPREGETYWTPMIYSPTRAVYAGVYMPCGDRGLVGAAFDCALNGLIKTPAR